MNSQRIKTLLREYLEYGGFPESALNKDREFRERILRSYYDDIINRDIVQRFKVKKIDKLRAIARFYLTSISSSISFNKMSRFIQLPTETVRRFSYYIEITNIVFFVKRFSYSVKEQENSPRKVYSIDAGLSNAIGYRFSENLGRLAENMVAMELKRRQLEENLEIYYWKKNYEVDFVVKDGLKVKELIQVCWDISSYETKERELKSLLKAMNEFKLSQGMVITEDFEGEEDADGKKIIYKPLWKWFLQT